jgi:hypothetical protein
VAKENLISIVGKLAVENGLLERFLVNPEQVAKEEEPGLSQTEIRILKEETDSGTIERFVKEFRPVKYDDPQDKSR